jgi:hypothetical protein
MSIVHRHLVQLCIEDPKKIAIRFHFNHKDSINMTIPKLVTFLLKEVLHRRGLEQTVTKLKSYEQNPGARPRDSEVLELLQQELRTYDRAYIILDAVDESPKDMWSRLRHYLVENLPVNTFLVCTSRPLHEIMTTFEDDPRFDISAGREDMEKYITSFFEEHDSLRRLVERTKDLDEVTVQSTVIERAGSM